MGAAADGYPDDPWVARALTVVTHTGMVPPIVVAWRCRGQAPFLLVTLLWTLASSTAYHACYSFHTCTFEDPRMNRKADHTNSPMIVLALATLFLWRAHPPRDGTPFTMRPTTAGGASRGGLEGEHGGGGSGGGGGGGAEEWGAPGGWGGVQPPFPRADGLSALTYYRPLFVEPLILALWLLHLVVEVAVGLDTYESYPALLIVCAATASAGATEAAVRGLVPDLRVVVRVFGPLALAIALFEADDALGSLGHSVWHLLGFWAIYAYMRWGPVMRARDGSHVRIRFDDPTVGGVP